MVARHENVKSAKYIVATLGLPLLLVMQACAYQRPQDVTAQMARTEAVLEQAQQSGAQEVALTELMQARDKFAEAQRAYDRESESGDREAMRLAKQAEVDAQYASAKAQAKRQQDSAREVEAGVRTLREQAQRSPATPPPVPAR
jgi:hypothetical protein